MGRQTTAAITERKTRLDGSVSEFACDVLSLEPGKRAVLRYVLDHEWTVGDPALHLRPGMLTVAHYWIDRPYNVYHWLDDGRTLAYYCNVAEITEISPSLVAYTDLVVDVLLHASGATQVLDEDELPADLAPAHRLTIAKALEALITNPRRLIAEIEGETRRALAG